MDILLPCTVGLLNCSDVRIRHGIKYQRGYRKDQIFEPKAPPIESRIHALKTLHKNGMRTYAFIGPVLPMDPEALCERLFPHVDHVYIDRMNSTFKTLNIYRRFRLQQWLNEAFTDQIIERLQDCFGKKDVST